VAQKNSGTSFVDEVKVFFLGGEIVSVRPSVKGKTCFWRSLWIHYVHVCVLCIYIYIYIYICIHTYIHIYIQGDSGGICITLGNDSMSDSKQKSS